MNQHSLLEAVNKLQKQTADNQQALLQVLGELKSYRQSHDDLERKINQYVSQHILLPTFLISSSHLNLTIFDFMRTPLPPIFLTAYSAR